MSSLFVSRKLRSRVLGATALVALALSSGLQAAAAPAVSASAEVRSYAIAAGPLSQVLSEFASAAGVALSFDSAVLKGRQSSGLRGSFDIGQGFAVLLTGTGLRAVTGGAARYVLRPIEEDGEVTLPPVRISGASESAFGPVEGYMASRSATATKGDTPLLETPQSIAIVGADQMLDQKAGSLTEALAYTPGVIADPGYANSYDVFYSRGFRIQDGAGGVYRDGLKLGGSGWATGQQETYGLERVELLKGAASVLYGAAAPGGVLNVVTKQPQSEPIRELMVEAGNYDHRALAADLGGTVSNGLAGRLVMRARDADTEIDYIPNDTRYVAPSLRWTPNDNTSLTLLAHYNERRTAYIWGVPVEGSLVSSPYGKLPRDRFVGEPDFDEQETRQASFGWLFNHRFADGLSLHHGLRWIDSENHVRFTNLRGPDQNDPRIYQRRAFDELETTRGISADTNLQAEFDGAGVQHKVVVGFDIADHRIGSIWELAPLGALNLFDPQYGAVPGAFAPLSDDRDDQERLGVYAQHQVKTGALTVLWGVRRDEVKSEFNGEVEKEGATTGRFGVVWELVPGLAPFISWSESFEPVSGRDNDNQRYVPTRGEQLELGVRWQRGDFLASAAAYELVQENVLTNRFGFARAVQTGEARSRGLEFEAKGRVARQVQLIAAYAYTDAETTESEDATEIGTPISYQPRHQASVWGRVDDVVTPGLHVGLGARYTGQTEDWSGTGAELPSYTTLDALVGFAAGPWTFRLNVNNLTDKTTLLCSGGWCVYGDGRRATASAAYRW